MLYLRTTSVIDQPRAINVHSLLTNGTVTCVSNRDVYGQCVFSARGPSYREDGRNAAIIKEVDQHAISLEDVNASFLQPNIHKRTRHHSTQFCVNDTSPPSAPIYPMSARESLPPMPWQQPPLLMPQPQHQHHQQPVPLQLSAPFLRVLAQAQQLTIAPPRQITSTPSTAWSPPTLSSGCDALRLLADSAVSGGVAPPSPRPGWLAGRSGVP